MECKGVTAEITEESNVIQKHIRTVGRNRGVFLFHGFSVYKEDVAVIMNTATHTESTTQPTINTAHVIMLFDDKL